MSKVVELLLLFARFSEKILALFKKKQRQREADALAENPAGWFGDHFSGGVPHDGPPSTKAKSDDHPA